MGGGREEEGAEEEDEEERNEAPINPTSPLGVGGLRRFFSHLPLFPFGGPGRGGSRGVRGSFLAQDGSKRAPASPRWSPRWLKIAQHGSI